ncbi:NUDIX domain-containing protein [Candidatus Dojkabacteria bacterium]|nr:NUDIX domain-containing protein [Candidatus Dojkabacteria bacterium]
MTEIERYLATNPAVKPSVVGYLMTDDGHVFLGLRKKVSLGLGLNLIAGIGGKVGDEEEFENETNEEALSREINEEIGVKILHFKKVAEVTFLFPENPQWNQFTTAYIIDKWEGTPQEKEKIQPVCYPIRKLPVEKMWEDNKYWLPDLLAGKILKAKFLYNNDGKTLDEYYKQFVKTF